MRRASPQELGGWDGLVAENPDGGQILQTRAWGEFKRAHHWTPEYLVSETGQRIVILELRHSVPGLGVLGYIPKGPGVTAAAELPALLEGLRATAGSAFAIKVEPEIEQSAAAVAALRDAGLRVLAADGSAGRSLDDLDASGLLRQPTAWLFGNEAWGMPGEVLALADEAVAVPIYGRAESLNLAAAAAVCLYASARAQCEPGR